MTSFCPVCLEVVSAQTAVWVAPDGSPAPPPPAASGRWTAWLRRLLGWQVAEPADWADWYAQGNEAHCSRGHPLPREFLARPTYVIGLVGEGGSSKSHYVAALVRELQAGHLGMLQMHVDLDPATARRFHHEYYVPLFEQHTAIPGTRKLQLINPATGDAEVRRPLTLVLRDWTSRRAVNLCLFDVAGEELADEQTQSRWARHLAIADGLMFFVDPAVLHRLPGGPAGDESGRGQSLHVTEAVITATSTLAHRGRRRGLDEDLPGVASAVLLAKADLVESRAAFPSSVLDPLDYDRETPATLGDRLSRESLLVERFLEQAGARNLVMSVLEKFPRTTFHAVTATGCSARNGRYETVEPRRCLEPLLSVLDTLGVVRLGPERP